MAYFFEGTYEDAGEVTRYRAKVLNLNRKSRQAIINAVKETVEDVVGKDHLEEMHGVTHSHAHCWIEEGKEKSGAVTVHVSRQNGEIVVDAIFIPATCWKDALTVARRLEMTDFEMDIESEWVNPDLN